MNNMKDEERDEERKYEFRKHKEKEGRMKSKAYEEMDKWLEDELRSSKKDEVKNEERERKKIRNGRRLMLY